ncbi:phage tail tape measure protein [Micromonospora sp. ATCC 39149]|uniref:phage tail tape measure protein n=1 Tax=Micromonospora sp. (strain ATCC 39149 / NRRL 15099 / SCC 1413) TaxID=219305 RepID=UPI0002E71FF6|nr:phage tail tape measure protein [Micromonospora sp. ATCC 39149]
MALKLGELVAYLKADDTALDRTIRAARGKLEQAGQRAREYGPVVGAALAAGIGAGLLQGLELDKARAKLAAQVGDPVLAQTIGEAAGRVYARGFGDSAGQAMEAAQAVVSSHLAKVDDAGAIERMTVKVHAYATAWGTDVATAAQYASTLIGSGLAKNADHAMDLIAAASARVPAALREDVLEAGNEYGQFFRSLGFNGEQAFALLVEASEKGQYGIDKAGDALKEFTIRATDMSSGSVAAYKAIGLDAEAMSNKILKGGKTAQGAFQQIISGLLSIKDPTKQANTAIALFGTPLEDLNVSDIPEFLRNMKAAGDGLGGVAGASDKAGEALEKSASQKLEAFKRQAQAALVDKLAEAIPMIEATFGWLSRNSGWVGPLATGLGLLAGIIGLIVLGTKLWAAAQIALNVAMMLNPVGLIILAVIGLIAIIVGLWLKFEGFRNFWKAVWEGIVTAFQWAVDWIVGGWTWLFETVVALAVGWWELFSGFWGAIGDFFVGLFQGWWRLFTGFWSAVFGGIADAWKWVTAKVSEFVDYIGGLPARIRAKARGMFDGLKDAFRSAINWMIGKWNSFSLTLGGGSVLGMDIPSVTLATPNIPYLAKGGHILDAGMAVVGERGPELVHLGRGATVQPLTGGAQGGGVSGTLRVILQWPDGRVIRDQIVDAATLRGRSVGAYLGITPT